MLLIAVAGAVAIGTAGLAGNTGGAPAPMPEMHPMSMPAAPHADAPSAPRSTSPSTSRSQASQPGWAAPDLHAGRADAFRIPDLRRMRLRHYHRFAGWPVTQCTYEWTHLTDLPPYLEHVYRPSEDCLPYDRSYPYAMYHTEEQLDELGRQLSPWHRFTDADLPNAP
jgi:hypothetical protein